MREKFVILAVKRWKGEVEIVKEVYLVETSAIEVSMRLFRACGLQKVILVDQAIQVRFKDTRICKCTNVQREVVGESYGEPVYRDVCMDCKTIIDEDSYMRALDVEDKIEETVA